LMTEQSARGKNQNNTVNINIEWLKEGDYFQKLTMYNHNYISIPALGNTTLIK
jgi:hypothetical protein